MKPAFLEKVLKYLKNRRIGVIQGGSSAERSISLKTGSAIINALRSWDLRVVPVEARGDIAGRLKRSPIDLAYLAVHGSPGEDGTLQGLLEMMGIPYTGSGVGASAIAMDKPLAKAVFRQAGVRTPLWRELVRSQAREATAAAKVLGLPLVVKPAGQGSAIGVTVVQNRSGLARAVSHAFSFGPRILMEQYISGMEVTVGILGPDPLPVIEIIPSHRFYDFYSKYRPGGSRHLVPARLPPSRLVRIQEEAFKAFNALHCRAYGRVDLMVPR